MKVTFFPRNDVNVRVCNNRWDKLMTYCENTDTLWNHGGYNRYAAVIMYAFRHNIKLGAFISDEFVYNDLQGEKALHQNGIISFDLYCQYQGGANDQAAFNTYADARRAWFKENFGYYPAAFSYSGGNEAYSSLGKQKFLAARSNAWNEGWLGDSYTWFNQPFPKNGNYLGIPNSAKTRVQEMLHPMSIRWCDEVRSGRFTVQQAIANIKSDIATTKQNHGFYNAFAHWHDVWSGGYSPVQLSDYGYYFENISDDDIHFCGWGEAYGYAVAREMLQRLSCYIPIENPNQIVIVGLYDNGEQYNIDCMNTPLSIYIDLTGTFLENKNIKVRFGSCIKVGTNQYIVEIPAPSNTLFVSNIIEESVADTCLNIQNPVIQVSKDTDIISVTCDQICNYIVFERNHQGVEAGAIIKFYENNKTSFSFEAELGKDYAIGAINKYKSTSLTNWV